MLKRIFPACLACLILVSLPITKPARTEQESPRSIRILVEGESSLSRALIEALRRANANHDNKLEFTIDPSDPYDLRLIFSKGSGSASASCEDSVVGVTLYYTNSNALGRDGKLLFITTHADDTQRQANTAAAEEMIKNIYQQIGSLMKESIAAGSSSGEEPPKEPGLYYKESSNWILLAESLSTEKVRGVGKLVMTMGMSRARFYEIYNGVSTKLRITQEKPEFYVRGFPVSEKDLAILQLKIVEGRREVESGSQSLFRGSSGYDPKAIRKLKTTQISATLYKLVPEEELKSGEYALDLDLKDSESGAYEFGISPLKK